MFGRFANRPYAAYGNTTPGVFLKSKYHPPTGCRSGNRSKYMYQTTPISFMPFLAQRCLKSQSVAIFHPPVAKSAFLFANAVVFQVGADSNSNDFCARLLSRNFHCVEPSQIFIYSERPGAPGTSPAMFVYPDP